MFRGNFWGENLFRSLETLGDVWKPDYTYKANKSINSSQLLMNLHHIQFDSKMDSDLVPIYPETKFHEKAENTTCPLAQETAARSSRKKEDHQTHRS